MASSVMWKELTAEDLRAKAAADAIVILPVASMEQHGPHLPVGVDTFLCEGVCKAAAELAKGEVVVAPTLWCGMAEHHMAFGGTFTFDIPTYRAVLLCFLKSIEHHGFTKVFIVNGHGGNVAALNAFLPDFVRDTGLRILVTTYPHTAADEITPLLEDQKGVMHACEAESSLMMVLAPDTVKHDRLKDAHGSVEKFKYAIPGSKVAIYRPFREMTPSGVVGDARRASKAKGKKLLEACAKAIAGVLADKKVWR